MQYVPSDITQLGLAGATLAILFFIVRYFVQALKDAREDHKELTQKFIDLTKSDIETRARDTESRDKFTEAIYKIIKNK
jgi:hypothetical protein